MHPPILLVGPSGVGKSTVAELLQKHLRSTALVALTDPAKEFGREVFGFSVECLWGPSSRRSTPYPAYDTSVAWELAQARSRASHMAWAAELLGCSKLDPEIERLRTVIETWFAEVPKQAWSPRDFCVSFCETLKSTYRHDIWTSRTARQMKEYVRYERVPVVTDLRPDWTAEITALRTTTPTPVVWEITRGCAYAKLDDADVYIDNDGSEEQLRQQVIVALES